MAADVNSYDAWFRAQVQEAFDDPHASTPHSDVMQAAQALIETKRQRKS